MSTMIGTRIAAETLKQIEYVAHQEHADKAHVVRELLTVAVKQKLFDLALEKYAQRQVSLGRAAELAHLPLADFMKLAAERKVPIHYSLHSLKEDFRAAQ